MTAQERARHIRAAMPAEGMFQDRDWRLATEPFALAARQLEQLELLGHDLLHFLRACDGLYRDSHRGRAPDFVARWLDQGKPPWLLEAARSAALEDQLPAVLRPDLLITDSGFALSEIDSVPGGIGLTAWLNATYADLGEPVIGGGDGMLQGFREVLAAAGPGDDDGPDGAAIVVSRESADYLPEMLWLDRQLASLSDRPNQEGSPLVRRPWELTPGQWPGVIYRFFELWDLNDVDHGRAMVEAAAAGDLRMTAPPKPWLEEKLWLALFHTPGLQQEWRRRLPDDVRGRLSRLIPFGWVLDPAPLPPHAEYPGLGIQHWHQLGQLPRAERQLVLKISGFSERGWGSRGVVIGHDRPLTEWAAAVDDALDSFTGGGPPWLLQRFQSARPAPQPWLDDNGGSGGGITRSMDGRTRLCPYYFVDRHGEPRLSGALATVCPADKKIIHGMRDAVMLPCKPGCAPA